MSGFQNIGPGLGRYRKAFDPTFTYPVSDTGDVTPPALPGTISPTPASIPIQSTAPTVPASSPTDEFQKDFLETGAKLRAALEPHPISTPRAVLGALVGNRNPMLGSVITGDYQRQRQIQPLQQQYGALANIITQNRALALEQARIKNYDSLDQRRQDLTDLAQNPVAKPTEEEWSTIPNVLGPNGGPVQQEKHSGQTREIPGLEGKPFTGTGKDNDFEQFYKQSLKDSGQQDTAANRLKARTQWNQSGKAPADPELASINKQLKQAQLDALQKKGEAADEALTPAAQKVMQDTTPVHAQIKDLMGQFESTKGDNTPFKHAGEMAKYKLGMSSQAGSAADTIAQLNLNRVAGGARILKGSSRAIQALNLAMQHLPNVWTDSDKLIYGKLKNLDEALTQIEDSARTYGKKSGQTPEVNPENPTGGAESNAPPPGAKVRDYTQLGKH